MSGVRPWGHPYPTSFSTDRTGTSFTHASRTLTVSVWDLVSPDLIGGDTESKEEAFCQISEEPPNNSPV